MRFRERMARFMEGRNGMDEFGRIESFVGLAIVIIGLVTSKVTFGTNVQIISLVCDALFLVVFGHMIFRMMSRNVSQRRKENQWILNLRYNRAVKSNRKKQRKAQSGTYKFFDCPVCRQTVRVPKGHGKISITCPRCKAEFIRKS